MMQNEDAALPVSIRLPLALRAEIAGRARQAGVSRALFLRRLLVAGLQAPPEALEPTDREVMLYGDRR